MEFSLISTSIITRSHSSLQVPGRQSEFVCEFAGTGIMHSVV